MWLPHRRIEYRRLRPDSIFSAVLRRLRRLMWLGLGAGLAILRRFPRVVGAAGPVLRHLPSLRRQLIFAAAAREDDAFALLPGEIRWMIAPQPAALAAWQTLLNEAEGSTVDEKAR